MFPFKTIGTGVLLLLLSAVGVGYVIVRPKPKMEALPAEPLVAEEAQPTPEVIKTPEPTPTIEETKATTQRSLSTPLPRVKTFSVKLVSPVMAQTFTAPAKVPFKVSTRPDDLVRVEFFSAAKGQSVCQSLTVLDKNLGQEKIGESSTFPYEFVWENVKADTYNVMAVATYKSGEQQISPPIGIIVNPTDSYESDKWRGWRQPYKAEEDAQEEPSLMPSPTPPPTLASCPTLKVDSAASARVGDLVTFRVNVTGGEPPSDLKYFWRVSEGQIVGGQGTESITVSTGGVLQNKIVANVEIDPLNTICPKIASTSLKIVQPRWLTRDVAGILASVAGNIVEIVPKLRDDNLRLYILADGGASQCLDENLAARAKLAKRYLTELRGIDASRIILGNGGYGPNLDFRVIAPDQAAPEMRPFLACNTVSVENAGYASKTIRNRACADLEEDISYLTVLGPAQTEINTCPYNPRDPQNSSTQINLGWSLLTGNYGNFPLVHYWTNGGTVHQGGSNAIWDLSDLKLKPGPYAALTKSDDSCDCSSINIVNANVTNFCTPCLTLRRVCYDSDYKQTQTFTADVRDFTLARLNGQTNFHWTTNKGTIVGGQGTASVTVDTTSLAEGTEFVVTVGVKGLQRYCVNKLSIPSIAGVPCPPVPPKVQVLGPAWGVPPRRAKRRAPEVEPTVSSSSPTTDPNGETNGTSPGKPRTNEKEWMKISWTPRVYADESINIKVVYNRTTESFQVSNTQGEVSEELKLGKLLKDWFGKDYETFGDVRLRTAGLKCDSCNQEQYQSLDRDNLEWSWPLKPEDKGTQSFNLELWVKGQPREGTGKQPKVPEKAWSRNDLKVQVQERMLTRNTVFAGGSLCAVLGLGLCVRGLKIYRVGDTYNVGQAVAVGRNVTMNNATVNQQAPEKGEKKDG